MTTVDPDVSVVSAVAWSADAGTSVLTTFPIALATAGHDFGVVCRDLAARAHRR
ncbi:hypothetical protein GCM10009682_50710 [Luedemannella flava]|uniref:Uncharacterized protein n=1 Tax=Luedemannella flava TaxID=349316 RepID=A0ABN2MFB7_9ACTN